MASSPADVPFPMARKGEAGLALSLSPFPSLVGGTLAIILGFGLGGLFEDNPCCAGIKSLARPQAGVPG
ncbi:hypothetical protein V1T76_22335 [Roseibium sp. FZY0029]|uniref:hypothetical protein n=1 Tax=Roseibium sp. FZY0029 TaxID=3116647 RepID=UPI002ECF2684|nr:hypothetical protein [Roseibium sp. FZY0029]